MPDTATEPPTITLDPDGVPVILADLSGDPRVLHAWGVVTADDGDAVALVLTAGEDPPTADIMRELADALDDDPHTDTPIRGCRAWEQARGDTAVTELSRQADRVIELGEALRHAEDRDRQGWELAATLQARAEKAERKLLTLKHGDGALKLVRAAAAWEERMHAARERDRLRHTYRGKGVTAAAVALLAGLMLGWRAAR